MGIDHQIYIGPAFVGFHSKEVVDTIEKRWFCPDPRCEDYYHGHHPEMGERRKQLPDEAKFCPTCAHKSVAEDVVIGQDEKWTPVWAEIGSALSDAGFHDDHLWRHDERWDDGQRLLFLHNGMPEPPRKFILDPRRAFYVPGTDFHQEAELDWFLTEFGDYYKVLQEVYGEDRVSATWGFFNIIW